MLINQRLVLEEEFDFNIEPNFTVLQIKQLYEKTNNTPLYQQTLILKGQPMEHDKTAEDYGLKEGSKLTMILSISG
ncbi:hypothetical protein BT63DRAFT_455237 [Microthyrium microscopicum]|uniref:Ubiquitin-like domain-containing protein n=1 Tax=Microthyrium microscopicum TaxID=703497 RepID=A0A6A6UBD3_9PEZI|nr:hypothetical protein BT63DRAFT_455237 [Microthyrium microscopicum]